MDSRIVVVNYLDHPTYLNTDKIVAMCKEDHTIFFEMYRWILSSEEWDKVFNVWSKNK